MRSTGRGGVMTPGARLPMALRLQRLLFVAAQLGLVVAANWTALELRFDGDTPAWALDACVQMLPWLIVVRGLTFVPFRLYRGMWRYTSVYDVKAIVQAVAVSSILFAALTVSPVGPTVYPRSILVIDAILLILALGGVRIACRLRSRSRVHGRRLLIIGAGDAGAMIAQDILARADYEYQPVGFVDDDPRKAGRFIHGVPVLGTRADVGRILAAHRPDEVLIAIPSADPGLARAIVRALEPHKIPIKTLPRLRDIIECKVEIGQIRTLAFEDLLARAPVGLDPEPLHRLIAGRRVLVTGAGGSIGGELCRQIAGMAPGLLVVLDRYENSLQALHLELQDRHGASMLRPVIGDVADEPRMNAVFALYRPEIVFHAAAHKHVPLMEDSPCEAIKNNVTGSRILAEVSERHGVDRFILISTDKAANPVNAMGASKRLAEMVVRAIAVESRTTFATVRFGNVLGSNGSVVPRFLEQIRTGGPLTVTHPEVRRFFMLIPEAVQLVLHAAAQAANGATYVLEMGEQVRVLDMARHLIRLSGFVPEEDIAIEFVGLRPGEKLSEELVGVGETVRPSNVDKIMCVMDDARASAETLRTIRTLEQRAALSHGAAVTALLRSLLPTYQPSGAPAPDAAPMPVPLQTTRRVDAAGSAERTCPVCLTGRLRVSPVRSLIEPVTRTTGVKRLFACGECGWREWLLPVDPGIARADAVFPACDLRAADPASELVPFVPDRRFSPRDLN
jgi:FlaA1/EpsC-like NDP-sugar epimerase